MRGGGMTNTERNRRDKARKIRRMLTLYGRTCHLCGRDIRPGEPVSRDHRIPRSEGGKANVENIRPSHPRCNNRRGNMPIAEFQARRVA